MRPLLVIAYAQHGQRSSGDYDPGAWADVDGDGVKERWEQEAPTAAGYLSLIAAKAEQYGADHGEPVDGVFVGWGDDIDPMRYDDGHAAIIERYSRPWLEWNPTGLVVVVCGHVNAGGGNYGVPAADARSSLGRSAAASIARAWEGSPVLGQTLSRVLLWLGKADGQGHERRIQYCIRGAYKGPANHCAVLLEPGFIDNPDHAALWGTRGLEDIASATVAGLLAWADA